MQTCDGFTIAGTFGQLDSLHQRTGRTTSGEPHEQYKCVVTKEVLCGQLQEMSWVSILVDECSIGVAAYIADMEKGII